MIIPRYCPIWSVGSPYGAVRACPFGRNIESCYCGILWGAEDIWDLHFLSLGLCPIKGKEIQSLPEVLGKNTIFQKELRWKESFGHWSLADGLYYLEYELKTEQKAPLTKRKLLVLLGAAIFTQSSVILDMVNVKGQLGPKVFSF